MPEHVLIRDLPRHVGKAVVLKGWAYNMRSSGAIAFLQMRDGTGRVQATVVKGETDPASWQTASEATIESSAVVEGVVKEDPRAPTGFEVAAAKVAVLQRAEEYPIGKKEHGPDFLLDHRHLWMRAPRQEAILRVRDAIVWAMRTSMRKQGFVLTDSPVFTPNACEGTSTLFEVPYFDDKAYLTQSGQLYLEATSAALGRTYDFGPVFRAEKSKTRRHLTEFWMLDAEASFVEFEENMAIQEKFVTDILQCVLGECTAELKICERDTKALEQSAKGGFPRVSYDEAVEKLHALGSDIAYGDDLGGDDETLLTQQYDRPIFVHHYPAKVKAFYMQPDPKNEELVLNNDLLAPEGYGEIIGGSERVHDLTLLRYKLQQHELPEAAFKWYMDLRRYGSVPHSGFGIGVERTVAWVCGLQHVRETIPFPRLLNRLYP